MGSGWKIKFANYLAYVVFFFGTTCKTFCPKWFTLPNKLLIRKIITIRLFYPNTYFKTLISCNISQPRVNLLIMYWSSAGVHLPPCCGKWTPALDHYVRELCSDLLCMQPSHEPRSRTKVMKKLGLTKASWSNSIVFGIKCTNAAAHLTLWWQTFR